MSTRTPAKDIGTAQAYNIKAEFVAKMKRENIKEGSKAWGLAHHDYFYGVMIALAAVGYNQPQYWLLCLMTNRSIVEDFVEAK